MAILLLCWRGFSDDVNAQDNKLTQTTRAAESTIAMNVENGAADRQKLAVLNTLAKGLLKTAYLNTFNIHSKSVPNHQAGIHKNVPNKVLSLELAKILTEIEQLRRTPLPNQALVNDETRIGNTPDTLENLVAKFNPEPPSKQTDVVLLEQSKQFQWPISGGVFSTPGSSFRQGGAKWPGILIKAKSATDVYSIAAGKVVYAGEMKNLGLLVIIDHEDGHLSLYGRNSKILVAQNQRIEKHQKISSIGSSIYGNNIGLYFEIRRHGEPIDPRLLCADTSTTD